MVPAPTSTNEDAPVSEVVATSDTSTHMDSLEDERAQLEAELARLDAERSHRIATPPLQSPAVLIRPWLTLSLVCPTLNSEDRHDDRRHHTHGQRGNPWETVPALDGTPSLLGAIVVFVFGRPAVADTVSQPVASVLVTYIAFPLILLAGVELLGRAVQASMRS